MNMEHPVNKLGFCQINIIVKDIELAAQKWAELLGIEVPRIRINHLEGNENYTYRGQPVSCDLKVCDIPMNGFVIELHQPIGGPSSFQEFIENIIKRNKVYEIRRILVICGCYTFEDFIGNFLQYFFIVPNFIEITK